MVALRRRLRWLRNRKLPPSVSRCHCAEVPAFCRTHRICGAVASVVSRRSFKRYRRGIENGTRRCTWRSSQGEVENGTMADGAPRRAGSGGTNSPCEVAAPATDSLPSSPVSSPQRRRSASGRPRSSADRLDDDRDSRRRVLSQKPSPPPLATIVLR